MFTIEKSCHVPRIRHMISDMLINHILLIFKLYIYNSRDSSSVNIYFWNQNITLKKKSQDHQPEKTENSSENGTLWKRFSHRYMFLILVFLYIFIFVLSEMGWGWFIYFVLFFFFHFTFCFFFYIYTKNTEL